jgi:hypothetical protein
LIDPFRRFSHILILLGLWHFADEGFLPAIALAMLALAVAAFCPEPVLNGEG